MRSDVSNRRRRILGGFAGLWLTGTGAGQQVFSDSNQDEEPVEFSLSVSIRQSEPTVGDATFIDITVPDEQIEAVDTWWIVFGDGSLARSETIDGIGHELGESVPGTTLISRSHIYNGHGEFLLRVLAELDDGTRIEEREAVTVSRYGNLVFGEDWFPDLLGPFDDLVHEDGWSPDLLPSFAAPVHEESWDAELTDPNMTLAHESSWDSSIVPPLDDLIAQEDWNGISSPAFGDPVHQESWETGTAPDGNVASRVPA
ncbi:hypothetical protein [Halovivax limisalsi]|uniref:hypothetical protein n=1 Tax=Halovivax limisalsi TaxID=1453760 RepID=UPI001FFCEE2F|nr:hypothetical protein [Halovivax limisalsi]